MESERKSTPPEQAGTSLTDRVVFAIYEKVHRGNPGALAFITEALNSSHEFWHKAQIGFARMELFGIVGDRLYMLWNDCCDRNTAKAVDVMLAKSIEDIFAHLNYERGRGIPFEDGEYE